MNFTFDEVCAIVGAKELRIISLEKELRRTRATLAKVTSGEEQDGEAGRDEGSAEQAEG